MAQNITLQGATYSDVPSVLLPKTGGGTASFVDVTDTTAAAADVASGKYFYTSAGVRTAGTASGGGGGVTKVASTQYTVSTTSTSATTTATWATGHSELWTSDKVVVVHIYDKAGNRDGYFYETTNFFINQIPKNGSSATSSITTGLRQIVRYASNGGYAVSAQTSTTGYGVYADTLYSDGRIRIRQRYNAGTSLTINGTYAVDVFLVDIGTLFP